MAAPTGSGPEITLSPGGGFLLEKTGSSTILVPEMLSDEQVMALRNSELGVAEQAALSELLERQREGRLSPAERGQLDQLLALYRSGLVRKARALKVAVERGLEPPIDQA